jgi:hypothetical protein
MTADEARSMASEWRGALVNAGVERVIRAIKTAIEVGCSEVLILVCGPRDTTLTGYDTYVQKGVAYDVSAVLGTLGYSVEEIHAGRGALKGFEVRW